VYRAACGRYVAAQQTIASFRGPNTEIARIDSVITTVERARRAVLDEVGKLKASYADAKTAYDAAQERGAANEVREAEQRVRTLLTRLDQPLAGATELGDEFSDLGLAGRIARLEAQRNSVARVVDTLLARGGADVPAPSAARSDLAVLSLLPTLERYPTATRYPALGALLLESERLRLHLDAARQRLASADARLGLLRTKRDALVSELLWLDRTRLTLDLIAKETCRRASVANDFEAGSPRCRELTLQALLAYANSWTLGRIPQEEADYRSIAARHAAVVDASENALAQWESLIGVPMGQLVAFHASGINPQDIAEFLYALGITTAITTSGR